MNQYSVWKYLLILIIVTVGVVYAIPNFYGEDPALQITSSRGFALPGELTTNIDDALLVEKINFSSKEQQGNRLLYRFDNAEDQIKASDAVKNALGDQYTVALNLAHATPDGLRAIGGKPMTLGLDLQGGVHFLMQVDMDTARSQQLDRYVDDIRSVLRDNGIRYVSVRHEGNGLLAMLRSAEDRDRTLNLINTDQSLQGLDVTELPAGETFGFSATVQEKQLLELQQTALKQNITTLRNRVNELGVAEPVFNSRVPTAWLCSCRVFRIRLKPRRLLVQQPLWNIVPLTRVMIRLLPHKPAEFRLSRACTLMKGIRFSSKSV